MTENSMTPHDGEETQLEAQVEAFGTAVTVRTAEGPGVAELFEEMLLAWRDSVASRPGDAANADADPDIDAGGTNTDAEYPIVKVPELNRENFEHRAYRFSVHVTTAALQFHRGSQLMFHAGGIARPDGAVAAIVGPSGRGKTTTMGQLARAYGYVSDETITITASGEVFPYRKPLSVITEGHVEKIQIPPSDLGLKPLPDAPLRITSLLLLERQPEGVEESRLEPVSLAEALIDLVQQTSYLVELPHPLRRIAEVADATGGVRRLFVGHPEGIIGVGDALFEQGSCGPWRQAMPVATSAIPYEVSDSVVDAVECEDGTVVLTTDRQARLLTGVAPTVWRGLCEGDTWPMLEARAVEMFGPPPTGSLREALVAVCDQLLSEGILVRHTE
ncbi:MAG: hypothetical protein ACK5LO_06720 [Leucobacter sp.]